MTAPGSVPRDIDNLTKQVAELNRKVDELSRKNIDRATVGQGGRIRGLYANGNEAFLFGTDTADGISKFKVNYSDGNPALRITPGSPLYGGVEQLVMFDRAQHRIMATDDLAGYGIVEPSLAIPMAEIAGLNFVAGVEQECAIARGFFYNPCFWSDLLITNYVTMTGVSCRLKITDGTSSFFSSATTLSGSTPGTLSRMIIIPSDFINKQNCALSWLLTSTGSGTVRTVGMRCHGISRSLFNSAPGYQ
jgi:hypothetical protein